MPAHYARAAFEGSNPGTGILIANVFHIEVDALTSPVDWDSVATDVYTWLGTLWTNCMTTSDTLHRIVVTDEDYPGSSLGQGVHSVEQSGARTTTDMKVNSSVCALASWKTNTAKRYARGHTFMPPAWDSAAVQPTNQLVPTNQYFISVGNFASAYQAGHSAGSTSYVPIVYSRTRVKRGETPFTFPIVAHQVSTLQHVLRSRLTAP